jgi:hypothetical protein
MIEQDGRKIKYLRELYRLLDMAQQHQHRPIARQLAALIARVERRGFA